MAGSARVAVVASVWPFFLATVTVGRPGAVLFRAGDAEHVAEVSSGALLGPRLQLLTGEEGVRGRAYGLPVRLSIEGNRLEGRVGGAAARLEVLQRRPGVEVVGILAGEPIALRILPTSLTGRFARCQYSLPLAGEAYSGWRVCEGDAVPEPVELELPRELSAASDALKVAFLVVVLLDELGARAAQPEEGGPQS